MSDPVPAVPPVVSPPSPVILFDGKTYNVIDGPDDNSPLVQVAHDQILQPLEIDKLVRNLHRTDGLLHIAACGVAGFLNPESGKSLSAQVMGLQYKLRDKTGEMGAALLSFGEAASQMTPILKGAFKDLYGFYEADCVGRLTRCETVATSMATTAATLKGTFKGLADEAQKIAEDTTQTRDLRRKAKEAAQTRQKEIAADLAAPRSTVLVAVRDDDVVACVHVVDRGEVAYLGMFAVSPPAQGAGLGSRLMSYAEAYVVERWKVPSMEMTVIDQRLDLIAFYERRGYLVTGEKRPFPYGDERFGVPLRDDLRFAVLRKPLG